MALRPSIVWVGAAITPNDATCAWHAWAGVPATSATAISSCTILDTSRPTVAAWNAASYGARAASATGAFAKESNAASVGTIFMTFAAAAATTGTVKTIGLPRSTVATIA